MLADLAERCNTIEECYEFMLAFAGQGLPSEGGSPSGSQIREFLGRAVNAISGLAENCTMAVKQERLEAAESYEAFFAVLDRDGQSSLAALELVLAQPDISSQLIDNLNASIHLRALLTDLFLLSEIVKIQSTRASSTESHTRP
jgi:hypothetical protein